MFLNKRNGETEIKLSIKLMSHQLTVVFYVLIALLIILLLRTAHFKIIVGSSFKQNNISKLVFITSLQDIH